MNDLSWKLADLPKKPTGPRVLSCFHCGGGSSMGYKLAGCDVVGGVDIDEKMSKIYRANLRPRWWHVGDIRTAPVPDEQIDILDGSPPCTPFSHAGLREKGWGKEKHFNEGQTKQRLDDLFFAYIDYAARVKPRVVVAENVTGILNGNARAYVSRIRDGFRSIGYTVQAFQLSAAHFGVPQARERVFFIAHRGAKPLTIVGTHTKAPTVEQAFADLEPKGKPLSAYMVKAWKGSTVGRRMQAFGFSRVKLNPKGVAPTICAQTVFAHWAEPVEISTAAYARLQSFPDDYDFGKADPVYATGMSVAPFVMRGIARQLIAQLF